MSRSHADFFKASKRAIQAMRAPELRVSLQKLFKESLAMRTRFDVIVDRAPVMASPDAFWARLDHRTNQIWLNGHVLDLASDSKEAFEFLVQHEIFHAIWAASPEQVRELVEAGFTEEEGADLLGYFSLQSLSSRESA